MAISDEELAKHLAMPPPPTYPTAARQSFGAQYENFVNGNMRGMREEPVMPVQAFDKIETSERESKRSRRKRQAIYIGIGCLLILAMTLIAVFVLRGHTGNDSKDPRAVQSVNITETATPSTTSTSSISVSVSISTTTMRTIKHATTTVVSTAPIPSSIAAAASSYYSAAWASVHSVNAAISSQQAKALTQWDSIEAAASITTLLTTTTPPASTVVETETAPPPAPTSMSPRCNNNFKGTDLLIPGLRSCDDIAADNDD